METIPSNIELFDRHQNGDLSTEEVEAFSQRLQTDEAFREAYQLYQESMANIQKAGFEQQLNIIMDQSDSEKTRSIQPLWFRGMAAAVILLLTSTGIYFFTSGTPEISYEPYPNILKFRTDKSTIPGLPDYSEGAYSKAIEQMEAIAFRSDTVHFYLAMSYMMSGKSERAIKTLQDIPSTSTFNQQKNWYMGILYYKIDDQKNALDILQTIKAGEFKFEEAQALIKTFE